jgi:hypothetical protein
MASGCAAESSVDFDQNAFHHESIGSVQQAATVGVGAYIMVDCRATGEQLEQLLGDEDAAFAVKFQICPALGSLGYKLPVIISREMREYYVDFDFGEPVPEMVDSGRIWYAVVPSTRVSWFNNSSSCDAPDYTHAFFTNGWDTGTQCRALDGLYYADYDAGTRTSECTWLNSQTGFKNAAAAAGFPVAANCSNVIGFDPLESSGQCAAGGWVC